MPSINRSFPRVDAVEKATGKAQYGADFLVDDLLAVSVFRSPHHHAKILTIDTEKALAVEGVVRIITADDIPGDKDFGPDVQDKPVLCYDTVRHIGDPIALVVATSKEAADSALQLIQVDFQLLPAVFDPVAALEESAPKIHLEGNLLSENRHSQGDIERGFAESDLIIEESFEVQRVSPAYLEPEVSTARWDDTGVIQVWANTQMPFSDRSAISKVLAVPSEKVHVITPYIGGSFGGKSDATIAILAALAAWRVKGSVRLVNSRQESMVAHPKRHPGKLRYKIGVKKDGTLVALKADFIFDTGAYASYGKAVGGISSEMAGGPYSTPNIDVVTRVAYTNTPFGGSVRGTSGPQVSFACESMMDIVAHELDFDPIEFRKKNMWRKGDTTYFGVRMDEEPSLRLCLDEAQNALNNLPQKPAESGKLRGVGVASSLLKMGMGYGIPDDSTCRIEWQSNDKVKVWLGCPEIGQGLTTVGTQIAADRLDLPLDAIELAILDTSKSPDGGPTNTSRTTMIMGDSLVDAAKKAIGVLISYTCEELDVDPNLISYKAGNLLIKSEEGEQIFSFGDIVKEANRNGIDLTAEATASFPYPDSKPDAYDFGTHVLMCYGVHVAVVDVDPVFGQVEVVDYIAIHDVGKAINPMGVEGQIEGGVTMGIGYALMEDMKLRPNNTWVDNFSEYIVPTILDVPKIRTIIVEDPNPLNKLGIKGLGEQVTVAVAPAIANAVFSATGKRITKLPIDSCDIL
jgi:CO/xanthine dehydrogenase Mo-binding subunit